MKLEEKGIEALAARARASEAENRRLRDKLCAMEGLQQRVCELERVNLELNRQLADKMDEMRGHVKQLSDFMLGKGPVTMSQTLRDAVEDAIRAEYEGRLREKDATIEDMGAKMQALKDEVERLRRGGGGNGGNAEADAKQTSINSLKMQVEDLRRQHFGDDSESRKTPQIPKPLPADELDLLQEDAPAIELTEEQAVAAALALAMGKAKPGPKGKHPVHPAGAYAEQVDLEPEGLPEGAVPVPEKDGEYTTYKVMWVDGYVRIIKVFRPKYKANGRHYQAPAPKWMLGRMEIDLSFLAHIMEMYAIQRLTIGEIERWVEDQGGSADHSTVLGWIARASDILSKLDPVMHKAIASQDNVHVDESTISVCDKPLAVAAGSGKDAEPESEAKPDSSPESASVAQGNAIEGDAPASGSEHFFVRWLYAFMSPSNQLIQYVFHNRGSRKGDAVDEYFDGYQGEKYLHTDGAKMYDKFASGDYYTNIIQCRAFILSEL